MIQEILKRIETSLSNDIFDDVENAQIELKDLSQGKDWQSLKETVCAFLNTNGGYIIAGVREHDKKYILTGFNRNNEPKIKELARSFNDDDSHPVSDIDEHLYFYYQPLSDKEVIIIEVRPLPEDRKYISLSGKFYERILTGDHEMPMSKVERQKEYKKELEYAKEITIVSEATIKDLSLDKINSYINLTNRNQKIESLKPNHKSAIPFLQRKYFLKKDEVTTLGLLVCGDDPYHFLENRCEIDCYYDTLSDISKDKAYYKGDVITLMENAFHFVWNHIKVGRSVQDGGISVPEYPEQLIRETLNNALAHRDYELNHFVTVNIQPSDFIEIKNPGSFKERIKINEKSPEGVEIRRIIPGIAESKNPKLADILKTYDKIESQGNGMAALVNAALNNETDIPYYDLQDKDKVCLHITSGKLVDSDIEFWLHGFYRYLVNRLKSELTEQHKQVLAYFKKSEELNRRHFYTILLSESNNHFNVIQDLKDAGLIYESKAKNFEDISVYFVDRVLMKTDYNDILEKLIGETFYQMNPVSRHILNIVYRYTFYNKESVRPVEITPAIYTLTYGKHVNPKKYESLGRKVRKTMNDLSKDKLLHKTKTGYMFNEQYHSSGLF